MRSNKIKLLYLGAFGKHCSDIYRVNGIEESGLFDLKHMDFRVLFKEFGEKMVESIANYCKNAGIEVILINKGEIFTPEMLKYLKLNTGALLYYWYGDMRDEPENFVKRNVQYYDNVLVNNMSKDYHIELMKYGAPKVSYSHTATDTKVFKRYENAPIINDVTFFGGNYGNKFRGASFRSEIINRLKNEHKTFKLSVHGNGWGFGNPLVFGNDFSLAASSSSMLLSISNYENVYMYTSNRLWNCMACGATLVHRFNGIDELFNEDEIIIFDNYDDLLEKIKYYKNNFEELNKIFKKGRAKIEKDHTYKQRAIEMFKYMSRELL